MSLVSASRAYDCANGCADARTRCNPKQAMAHSARRIGDAQLTDPIGRRSESGARSRPVPRRDFNRLINADVLYYFPFGAECCDGDQ